MAECSGAIVGIVQHKEDNCYPFAAVFDTDTVANSNDENLGNRRLPTALFFPLGSVGTVAMYLVDGGDGHTVTALAVEDDIVSYGG